jgi:hypothetical protein
MGFVGLAILSFAHHQLANVVMWQHVKCGGNEHDLLSPCNGCYALIERRYHERRHR